MSDPFRLRVLKALTDHLKQITPANDYESDLSDFTDTDGITSERVIRGRDRFGEGDPLPFVSILEDFRANAVAHGGEASTKGKSEWKLLIQGFVKDDPVHKTDAAYVLAADVVKALIAARAQRYSILGLGEKMPCVVDLKMDHPVVRPPDGEISSVSFFFLTVTLTLVEDMQNPFA